MSFLLRRLLMIALCLSFPASVSAGALQQKLFTAKSYPGSRDRQYQVFVPSAYNGQDAVPMVMVLHGCQQTEVNMINETRFKDLAERDNFIVVYPFITSWDLMESRDQNCWGFWFSQHIHQGRGEVEDLRQIAGEVEAGFRIDPNRRYAAGLSSGAAMSVVLGVAYSEYFAAVGSVAGLPYSETPASVNLILGPTRCSTPGTFRAVPAVVDAMRAEQGRPEEQRQVPIMAIHSLNDCTVRVQASENIRDSWLARYGIGQDTAIVTDCTTQGVRCEHRRFGPAARSVVETAFYDGRRGDFFGLGAHYWVGDNSGQYADPNGPSASEFLWVFFKAHPFADAPPPTVVITSAVVSGTSLTVSGTAAASGGTVTEVAVRLEGRFPQPRRVATGTTSWSVLFSNMPIDATYVPVVSVTDSGGATATATGTPAVIGTPPPKPPPTAAIGGVSVAGNCVTVEGTASDTEGQLAGVEVQLGDRSFRPAALVGRGGYRYEECGLAAATYATHARAFDAQGTRGAVVSGPSATVSNIEAINADWLTHQLERRLKFYAPPCASVGFGACDAGFAAIFAAHSFNPFPLYRVPSSNDWFVDPQSAR